MNDDKPRNAPTTCDTCGRAMTAVAPSQGSGTAVIRCDDCARMREYNPERWDKLFMQTNGNYP